jgi:hypothetical protein
MAFVGLSLAGLVAAWRGNSKGEKLVNYLLCLLASQSKKRMVC